MRKLKYLIVIILICVLMIVSCKKPFTFPDDKDFLLTVDVSNKVLKEGEELKVRAVIKNLTDKKYTISSGASFSKSGLIHIDVVEFNENDDFVFVGSERIVDLSGKQEMEENTNTIMDKKGKYKLLVRSIFSIINPTTKEDRKYIKNVDPIIIEVN